jgi:hypothetical protein
MDEAVTAAKVIGDRRGEPLVEGFPPTRPKPASELPEPPRPSPSRAAVASFVPPSLGLCVLTRPTPEPHAATAKATPAIDAPQQSQTTSASPLDAGGDNHCSAPEGARPSIGPPTVVDDAGLGAMRGLRPMRPRGGLSPRRTAGRFARRAAAPARTSGFAIIRFRGMTTLPCPTAVQPISVRRHRDGGAAPGPGRGPGTRPRTPALTPRTDSSRRARRAASGAG